MSLYNTIILGFCLLFIPNLAQEMLSNVSSTGNMGLAGVYLDIIKKRNIVYFFGLVIMINKLFFETKILTYFCYILFSLSIANYFNTINNWCFIIT